MADHDTGVSTPPLTAERRARYLQRIGFTGVPRTDLACLRALQRAHLLSVPFENLDIHLGRRIALDVGAMVGKIVDDRRGGFCYELNGSFAALLAGLGFSVTMHEALVTDTSVRFDHLALLVAIGSDRYLADVGFGAFADEPLDAVDRGEQHDTAGTFRIADHPDGWLHVTGPRGPEYRFSSEPSALQDFQPGCSFHQTPASHFAQSTVCSLRTAGGRVTLSGLTLTETVDGARTTTDLMPAELGAVLVDRFGVRLADDDVAALARVAR
jgi:N-hydroxyarylamine O-acetyltransferase